MHIDDIVFLWGMNSFIFFVPPENELSLVKGDGNDKRHMHRT